MPYKGARSEADRTVLGNTLCFENGALRFAASTTAGPVRRTEINYRGHLAPLGLSGYYSARRIEQAPV